MKHAVICALALLCACDEPLTPQSLPVTSLAVEQRAAAFELSALPSFADERGGGVFVDLAGRVTRLRSNGARGVLETHPGNGVWPGPATGVFALAGNNALVDTSRGVFAVGEGWLISPAWQQALPAGGLKQTAVGADGTTWLLHEAGVYRLTRGILSAFTVDGETLAGATSIAVAPAPNGSPALWLTREGRLWCATQTGADTFSFAQVELTESLVEGGVIALAGLSPRPGTQGELWAMTPHALLTFTGATWRNYAVPGKPRALMSAGRFVWLEAGDGLYRRDGDGEGWQEVTGLQVAPTLLAADTAGAAWVRVGEDTFSIAPAEPVRLTGLVANEVVYDSLLMVHAALPASLEVEALTWQFDDLTPQQLDVTDGVEGEGPTAGERFWSLGGVDEGHVNLPLSLGALDDDWHTLTLSATVGGEPRTRKVHFQFAGSATATVSWEADIQPIYQARCVSCHETTSTTTRFMTYEAWVDQANSISAQVRAGAMPPGGMDRSSVSAIVRWVNGGALP